MLFRSPLLEGDLRALSRVLTALENGTLARELQSGITREAKKIGKKIPVLGITGTGGSGKSSLTDELVRRFRLGQRDRLKIAIIAVDPTRRKTGGALLGDRIRMNAINHPHIFMRSVATRDARGEVPGYLGAMIDACRLAQFDLIIIEIGRASCRERV